MRGWYWWAYWILRGWRDAIFVKAVARRIGDSQVLFIHPNARSGPAFYIARMDADIDTEPKVHLEGMMR